MSALPTSSAATSATAITLTRPMILLLAVGAGLAVASLYYSQPMLGVVGTSMHADDRMVGWIPTLTQLGYATGLLFLAPLGDRFDRRRIIIAKAAALTAALAAAGLAPSMAMLLAASFAIGLAATLAQDIIPAAATLAPEARRGSVVGTVMTGLLLGILLSRVVSGFVAEQFGWRLMFLAAAASIALLMVAVTRGLPRFAATTRMSYGALLRSLVELWVRHPALRRATIAQGLLAVAFSAFWSTLALMLHDEPFHMGAAVAGSFGLAGAVGPVAAPVAGRIADRRGPELVIRLGATIATLSFAAMALTPWLSPHAQLGIIIAGTIGFDLGVQASLIAHQSIVYSIDPPARSRLNAVLMTGMFIGMAAGASLASQALATWGWMGVVGLTTAAAAGALAVRLMPGRQS